MIDELIKEKIKQFLGDKAMAKAVRDELENEIKKRHGAKDVYVLAAERIALDVIDEAWLNMQRLKMDTEPTEERRNVGI